MFFVCSFRNFRKYTFNSLFQIIAKNVLQVTSELYTEIQFQGLALRDQAEDRSTLWIGVSHGTISTLSSVASEDRRERVERKKDNRIVNKKNF